MAEYKESIRNILNNGLAKPNRFNVVIELPNIMQDKVSNVDDEKTNFFTEGVEIIKKFIPGASNITRGLSYSVEQTELPGKSLTTTEVKYNGDFYKIPYGVIYGVHPFTFRVSRDSFEKNVIDDWMLNIYDSETHTVNYFNDYTSRIIIEQLDSNDRVVHSVVLIDAFPIISNAINLDQGENNTYERLMVQFAYRKWKPLEKLEGGPLAGSLSQTPLGPFVAPILSNPAVQRGLEVLEKNTGIDLEGEAVNIYNTVDEVVRNTTGNSINEGVRILNGVKVDTQNNNRISAQNQSDIIGVIDDILSIW